MTAFNAWKCVQLWDEKCKKGKKDPDAVKMGVPGDQVSHATCYDNAVYILCNLLTN